MSQSRNAAADSLAQAHFSVDPGVQLIFRLLAEADREMDPKEPIKLLEVNENAVGGGVRPLFFGPHPASGMFFPSVIVDVTPEEYEEILNKPGMIPNGWRLGPEIPSLIPATAK